MTNLHKNLPGIAEEILI